MRVLAKTWTQPGWLTDEKIDIGAMGTDAKLTPHACPISPRTPLPEEKHLAGRARGIPETRKAQDEDKSYRSLTNAKKQKGPA